MFSHLGKEYHAVTLKNARIIFNFFAIKAFKKIIFVFFSFFFLLNLRIYVDYVDYVISINKL